MRLDIPSAECFVSAVSVSEGTLSLRLATDVHPGFVSGAYELRAHGIHNLPEAISFLNGRKENCEYVYVHEKGECIVVTTESGSELLLYASRFTGTSEKFNAEELSTAFSRVYGWYESEYKSNVASKNQLNRIRELLVEQARRVEIKAKTHSPNEAAGVLYSQQLAFIERLLREFEI